MWFIYDTQATHGPVGQTESSANRIMPVCAEDPFAPIIGILLNHILPATPIQTPRNHAEIALNQSAWAHACHFTQSDHRRCVKPSVSAQRAWIKHAQVAAQS